MVDLVTADDIAQALEGTESDERSISSFSIESGSVTSDEKKRDTDAAAERREEVMASLLMKLKRSARGNSASIGLDESSKSDKLDIHETILDSPQGVFLRFTVMDRGVGIPEEERKKLFKPFAQMQRLTGGTGLGLFSLSKRMEAIGGQFILSTHTLNRIRTHHMIRTPT